ncbi:MAG: glycosyltransferase [Candidatus Saccharibacteria bacterium]|nr:glycosyltransferase [Candidatus Saccharibacteria bacterium]
MKIAIASDIYWPMTNGVAVFAHNLANGLAQAGHEVLVIAPSFNGKRHVTTDKETGVKTVHLSSARFPFYPDQINKVPAKKEVLGHAMPRLAYKNGIWWSYNPFKEVNRALDEFQPDVIHLQTAETIALAIMRYVKKNDVPLVSTGHAYPDNVTSQFKIFKPTMLRKPANAAVRWYMASFLKHAEYATMPTEMAIGDLVPKNRKHFQVTVEALSNGVDLTAFKPGRPSAEIMRKHDLKPALPNVASRAQNGVPRVLYVGRVDPEKSISNVVYAFQQVLNKIPEAELVIVGDGIDVSNLKNIVAKNEIPNVKFLGKIMMPELLELYRSANVFATASETETQGIVLIEAAATGLPLVAVDAGAVKELCQHHKNGELCQPGDIDGIAKALVKILTKPEIREKYSKGSMEIAERHDLKKTLARFEEIYNEAIQLKNNG